ncbi:MAG: glycosyltransferase family 4 protein [Thermodesulfobacteriota bacterium]
MQVAQIAPPWIPVPPVTYGGTELMVANLITGLQERGVEVWLFSAGDSTLPVPQYGHFIKSFWPPDKFSENLHLSHAFFRLRERPPLVIHSHLENAAGFWALAPAAPLVITIHTPLFPMKREYLLSFPHVHLVTVSAFQQSQLTGHPYLHLIPHGLNLADYPFQAAKEDFLLFLGRIYPDKGLHTAIHLARETGTRLLIAGPVFEPDRPYFEQEIRNRIDGDRIVYLGPANHARKVDLMQRARGLVLPLEVDETFGLAMIEAMACGTPVLAYGRGAVPEVVVHGETGFVVKSYEELRHSLPALTALNPHRCREHVALNFSRDRMVKAYLELYEGVCQERRK